MILLLLQLYALVYLIEYFSWKMICDFCPKLASQATYSLLKGMHVYMKVGWPYQEGYPSKRVTLV
jgi:hypothetical protein